MSIEIDVVCSYSPDVTIGCKIADLVLRRCLSGYLPLEIESNPGAITLTSWDVELTVVTVPEGFHEFPDKHVVSIRSEVRQPYCFLACFVVASSLAYCFEGDLDLDNWIFKSKAEPDAILVECLRHESVDAQWLLDKLAKI